MDLIHGSHCNTQEHHATCWTRACLLEGNFLLSQTAKLNSGLQVLIKTVDVTLVKESNYHIVKTL